MATRDEKGRFVKGTSGNPNGRPTKEREEKYYNIAMNTVMYTVSYELFGFFLGSAFEFQTRENISDIGVIVTVMLHHRVILIARHILQTVK